LTEISHQHSPRDAAEPMAPMPAPVWPQLSEDAKIFSVHLPMKVGRSSSNGVIDLASIQTR
jgi:hypothetical protein